MDEKAQLEKRREGNRIRQKRWRDRHRWLAKQRRLACYGKSDADEELASVTNNAEGGMYDQGAIAERVVGREPGAEEDHETGDRVDALAEPVGGRDERMRRAKAALEAAGFGPGGRAVLVQVQEPPAEDSSLGVEVEGF